MSALPSRRIEVPDGHLFSRPLINRAMPISFTLNGWQITGYAGDTILSAALASGVAGVGTPGNIEVNLDLSSAPLVRHLGGPNSATLWPAERTGASDGAQYQTLGSNIERAALSFLRRHRAAPSIIRADIDAETAGPWLDAVRATTDEVDMIVVGGGLAGLSAAKEAARNGSTVALFDRRLILGGRAGLFGQVAGEERDEDLADRLETELRQTKNVRIFTAAEVFAIDPNGIMVHRIDQDGGEPRTETMHVAAKRLVLATGALEQLPIVSGNRLPGVRLSSDAFHMARAFGFWPSGTTMLATATSAGYRLGMLASDGGAGITRIIDSRIDPQSRFIEFTKAYGIPLSSGLAPMFIARSGRKSELSVTYSLAWEERSSVAETQSADNLILAAGWRPDLALWQQAGGSIDWQTPNATIRAVGRVENVALAGTAAGYSTASSCMESGRQAVRALFGREISGVEEMTIDPIFETPDGPLPIKMPGIGQVAPAWLDAGVTSHTRIEADSGRVRSKRVSSDSPDIGSQITGRALAIGELDALLALGACRRDEIGQIAAERCIAPMRIEQRETLSSHRAEGMPTAPAYIQGRFGGNETLCRLQALDGRTIEMGTFLFGDPELINIERAIGVVFLQRDGQSFALAASSFAGPGEPVTAWTAAGAIWCRLLPVSADPDRPNDELAGLAGPAP